MAAAKIGHFHPRGVYNSSISFDITAICFSGNGRYLAAATRDGEVVIWDTDTKKQFHNFKILYNSGFGLARANIHGLSLSPDGQFVAAASFSSAGVSVWDLITGKREFPIGELLRGGTVAFSPDGKLLAIGRSDSTVRLIEVASRREIIKLEGHRGRIMALDFSDNGRFLASGSRDNTVVVWNLLHSQANSSSPKPNQDFESLWKQLRAKKAATAFSAVVQMCQSPEKTVKFLNKKLSVVQDKNTDAIRKWTKELSNENAITRKQAMLKLSLLDGNLPGLLRQTILQTENEIIRKDLTQFLVSLKQAPLTPGDLQTIRTIQLLEWIGTKEAESLLKSLAAGNPILRRTQEASAALQRLKIANSRPDRSSRNVQPPLRGYENAPKHY